MAKRLLALNVNGRAREIAAADSLLLLDLLRDELRLTGTKRGCDGGECGACTVLVDGRPQLACITLAARRASAVRSTFRSPALRCASSPYQRPRSLHAVQALPRTATGKLLRRRLATMAAAS